MKFVKALIHFGVRVACTFSPRRTRRRIRIWYKWNFTWINQEWAEAIYKKKAAYQIQKNRLRTLLFGSSHGDYGFIPAEGEFNLCGASQDLYTSYELYKRWGDLPELKTVFLFYSVFSSGSETEKTIERERCLYYHEFFDVPYRFHEESFWRNKKKALEEWLREYVQDDASQYRGLCDYKGFLPVTTDIAERVNSHLKNNRRNNGQVKYVEEMLKLAKARGHKFVVVIPPFRSDYTKLLPPYNEVFGELLAVLRRHHEVQLLSFVGDSSFDDADFGDMDHLNRSGAEKLTKRIYSLLHRVEKQLISGAKMLSFPVHGDHTGSLVALEKSEDFPFEIKRVYYIWGTAKDVVRGHHAHKNLEQVIVCTSGSCDFILDNGTVRETYHLDSPANGLYIRNNIWREFTNFSPDCVVMVLASEHYNEADYIRNYDDFLRSIGNGKS